MFVTMPQFEQTGMSKLAGGGQQYWRAITANLLDQHWYLFVYEGQVLEARLNLTLLVAWEETLIQVMNLVPEQDRKAVYRIDRGESGRLLFRCVDEIWTPTTDEVNEGVVAVLALEGERELVDPALRPLPRGNRRQLVFQTPLSTQGSVPVTPKPTKSANSCDGDR